MNRFRPHGLNGARPRRRVTGDARLIDEETDVERVCFTLQVRPERLEEYRSRHAEVWPDMLRALRDTGWRRYSLFLRDDGLLVGYLETDDLAAAVAGMGATDVNRRWQAEMAELFLALDVPADQGLLRLDEVFDLDDQLAALGEATTATTHHDRQEISS